MNIHFSNSRPWVIVVCLIAGLYVSGCKGDTAASESSNSKFVLSDSLLRIVQIDTAKSEKAVNSISLNGKVAFNEDKVSRIYPPVSGNVNDVRVELGDYVKKGQTLALIHSAEMAGYSNDLSSAEASLKLAKQSLDATQDMFKSGLASSRDLVQAQTNYDQAQAAVQRAQRVIQLNGGSSNGIYEVKSPINGFIVEKFITNNMIIRPDNGSQLLTISNLDDVWVIANVYESNIRYLKAGEEVQVTTLSYPGKIFKGRIDKIMNVLDPTNKVLKVRIVLPNPGYYLKPEMFASVRINITENEEKVCVPASSLIFDNSQYYVLVYKSPSDIEIRPVEVDNSIGGKAYIRTGLQAGERIISTQALLIYQELNV